ncbi:MAG: hypothetical protein ABEI27_10480 [Halobellus sp.]|uniref:hypothetical protein n=1 Tax=Halobellus sp. TaxID=1979212 RepID=UPI0035D431CF
MAKQPYSSFDVLASVIEQLGADGRSVDRVEAAADGEDGELRATVEIDVPLDGDDCVTLEPSDATDDGLQFDLRLSGVRPSAETCGTDADLAVSPVEATLDGATVEATLEVVICAPTESRSEEGRGCAPADGRSGEPRSWGAERTEAAAPTPSGASESTAQDSLSLQSSDSADGISASVESNDRPKEYEETVSPDEPRQSLTDGRGELRSDQSTRESDSSDAAGDEATAVRDESIPPYEDTAYLRRLYETCETFDEMSERIEMDVSAETVRRYMIDAGVHSPRSYTLDEAGMSRADSEDVEKEPSSESVEATADSESSDDDEEETDVAGTTMKSDANDTAPETTAATATSESPAETVSERAPQAETKSPSGSEDSPDSHADGDDSRATLEDSENLLTPETLPDEQLIADGIGLPETLTLPDVIEAIVDSRTVHEVGRELGLDHDRTRRLLRQLNVLDLVLCRVSNASTERCTVETVTGRIRQCTIERA